VFGNYLIGLREGLEAALIVGILVAYLVRTGRRNLVAGGVSLAFGALLTFGPTGLSFEAQEIIGGTLSIVAVGFVTWMIFWMAGASRSMKGNLERRLDAAAAGGASALTLVAALAVGREGLETALFLWAATKATGSSSAPLIGASLGLLTAVVLGVAVYRGALRLDLGRFFRTTGTFLVIIAAGVLSYGIHDLQEARVLPGLRSLAFDVSKQIPPSSWYGTLLKGTINFTPTTTWLQVAAWAAYLVPVTYVFVRRSRPATSATATPQNTKVLAV
jgi:high-affinity iron transporter